MVKLSFSALSQSPRQDFNKDEHLIISCNLATSYYKYKSTALINTRASSTAFINQFYTQKLGLSFLPLSSPIALKVVDGRPAAIGDITHFIQLRFSVDSFKQTLLLYITRLGHFPVILGYP